MRDSTWWGAAILAGLAGLAGCGGTSGGGDDGEGQPDAAASHGLHIAFDYRFDDAGFFAAPERQATLEAAAATWSLRLGDDFAEIPAGTSVRTRDPEAPDAAATSFPIDAPIDDVLIFAGCSTIDGDGGVLAKSNSAAALNSVTDPALAAALRTRYEGANFEPWTGWISFDCSEPWFDDATPATADDLPNQPDFLSTAAHEIGHVLGFGTAMAHVALVDGTHFTGAQAAAAFGGPVPLIADGTHFTSGLASDGHEPLMDPSRGAGTRSLPTTLDVAAMLDLGYQAR